MEEKLPFEDQSFNKVRADRAFQHLKDPHRVLDDMVRVTSKGGYLQIVDTEWDTMIIDTNETEVWQKFKNGILTKYENRSEEGDCTG